MSERFTHPPDLADIEIMAREALDTIPEMLRERARDVVIRVVDFPDPDTERDMGLQSPFDLLGLYHGIPFGERGVSAAPQDLDMIFLYRRPLLDYWCETGEDLSHLVRHVLIHEIGHHFGFSDDDMERIEAEAEADD
jgi:predicted Zn-dependent protease with MMP-like domain